MPLLLASHPLPSERLSERDGEAIGIDADGKPNALVCLLGRCQDKMCASCLQVPDLRERLARRGSGAPFILTAAPRAELVAQLGRLVPEVVHLAEQVLLLVRPEQLPYPLGPTLMRLRSLKTIEAP